MFIYCQSLFLKFLLFLNALSAQTVQKSLACVVGTQNTAVTQENKQSHELNAIMSELLTKNLSLEQFIQELNRKTQNSAHLHDVKNLTDQLLATNKSDRSKIFCLLLQLKAQVTEKLTTPTQHSLLQFIKTLKF